MAPRSARRSFKEMAQQVLEYLGVPHDEPMQRAAGKAAGAESPRTTSRRTTSDLQALFAEVNDLPADDPLRGGDTQQTAAVSSDGEAHGVSTSAAVASTPAPVEVAGNSR